MLPGGNARAGGQQRRVGEAGLGRRLQIHPQARKASEAAVCALEQDKFWQLHDDLFANQKALGIEQIKERAAGLGLETAKLSRKADAKSSG